MVLSLITRHTHALKAVLLAGMLIPAAALSLQDNITYLDQGWDNETRARYYHTPQGSQMIPYAWFMALETPDGGGLFADAGHLAGYGLLSSSKHPTLNPDGLPVGFAIEPSELPGAGKFLGMTCAACHTSEVNVDGQQVRIDGGAAHFDFDSFYRDLAASVDRTLFDQATFTRFALRVIASLPVPPQQASADEQKTMDNAEIATLAARSVSSEVVVREETEKLRFQLAAFQARMAGDAAIRRPETPSGFGRVDALTQIVNALSVSAQGTPHNLRPADAPVSYPHVWLAPQLEFVQWNPIASGAIGRNGGEVLGVFGNANLETPGEDAFSSTILVKNLHALEQWINTLTPPEWDEELFGAIDSDAADTGKTLFGNHCAACHSTAPYPRTEPEENKFGKTFIKILPVDYKKVGTDPVYVESLVNRIVQTNAVTAPIHEGKPIVPAGLFFRNTAGSVIQRAMNDAGLTLEQQVAFNDFRIRPDGTRYEPECVTCLKAGPLAGIWASGPYLHNGSVPTIYELLSPEDERRDVFFTGGKNLDREKVGFLSEDAPGRFRFDTSVKGNGNQGHNYPPQGLSHDERMALIAYIKTL